MLALPGIHSELSPQSLNQRQITPIAMKLLPMNQPTIDIEPANSAPTTAQRFVDRITSMLARLSLVAVVVFLVFVMLRIAAAVFVHHRIVNAGSDFARVSGLDSRMSFWLEGPASWTLTFALTSIFLRTIWLFAWPFGKSARSLRVPLMLFAITGLGALVPSMIQKVRGVNADGLPVEMVEIGEPAGQKWFAPDGTATLFYSRETDGSLRFWNRTGLTPDRRVESQPVTSEVRSEWERAESARAATKRSEAEALDAVRLQEDARQRLASEKRRRADQERLEAQRASEAQRAAEFLRQSVEGRAIPQSGEHSNAQSVTRLPQPAPEVAQRPWARYRLIAGKTLRINTEGRPCSIRTDTTVEVFPNNPSLAHRIVPAYGELHFPLLRGQGPASIHARPLGMTDGTILFRYAD